MAGPFHRGDQMIEVPAEPEREHAGGEKDRQERRGHSGSDPKDKRSDAQDRKRAGARPASAREQPRGLRAPPGQRLRVHPDSDVLAEQSQLLPKVERRRQLPNGLVANPQILRLRRGEQPSRQRLLSRSSSGRRKVLKQRPLPEQVQVLRIRVQRIQEPIARFALAGPAVLNAAQDVLVESHGPGGQRASPQGAFVDDRERDYGRERRQQPENRERAPDKRQQGHDGGQRGQPNLDVA